jgi:ligand-binding sensor domain-containing protein/signal transduction histidine kinase
MRLIVNLNLRQACRLLLLLWLGCASAFAAAPAGFTRKLWQAQDGLPVQTVQAYAQTADGYLWIGTTGGLLRFDGSRFKTFEVKNTRLLEDNGVFVLLASRDGNLWIGTEGGGLVRYRSGNFQVYGPDEGLKDGFVRALYQDSHGTIWVGTDGGLLRFAGDKLEHVDSLNGIPSLSVHTIVEDHLGGLWVGGNRLLRLSGNQVHEYHLAGGSVEARVKSILETRDHTLWIGTVAGLLKLPPGANEFERVKGIQSTVRVLRQTSDDTLWIGTIGQGIRCWKAGEFSTIGAPDSLPSNTVLNMFEDDEKNLWIGTQAGMLRLTRTAVTIVPLPQATDSDYGTIYQDRDGTLWVISTDIFRVRNGVAQPYTFPQLGHIRARNVYRDRAGALWIGTDGDGVIRLRGKQVLHLTTKNGLIDNLIRAMLEARDGSLWFLTDGGVSHWTSHKFVNYEMKDGLSFFSTRAVIEDRGGDLWIGTDRGVSHMRSGVFLHDAVTAALSQERVWAIHEDGDGGLWFGTRNNGLYRWRNGALAHYTAAQGLASNSIYAILEDAKGGFWISGSGSISLLDRRDLDRAAEHPAYHLQLTLFSIADEVEAAQIYGGRQPSGCLDLRGDVWFPSNKGPIHIVRDAIQPLPPSRPVMISDVVVNGRNVFVNGPVPIEPGYGRVEISYAPVLLRSQDGLRFQYRLDGFDENWIDASNRRTASYTSLPPGKYMFRVAAFEVNNPRAISQASITIVQQPHYYLTGWFIASCVALLAALIFTVYRFRLWQIKMRFEAVLDERGRLAREMHDTVIQGCAGVSAVIEALVSLPMENHDAGELMEHARAQVRKTIDEARQAVWNLRQEKPSDTLFGPALQGMAKQISTESGIPITCELVGKPFALNQFVMHELVMMSREALYNAALHARPSLIEAKVSFAKKDLTLEVHDDGGGFDPMIVPSAEDRHYGLLGMRERVQAVGGKFTLQSTLGKGTHLRIQIPRKVSMPQTAMLSA